MTTPIAEGRLGAFQDYLVGSGIPVFTITDTNGTVEGLTILYTRELDQTEQNFVDNAKTEFTWDAIVPKSRIAVVTQLDLLNSGQIAALNKHMLAEFYRNNPTVAASVASVTGVPLAVSDVVPS